MNTNLLVGGIFGAVAVTAAGSYAGYNTIVESKKPQFAEVVDSKAITETYYTDRQECYDEVVQHQAEVKDGNQVTGTVIGAVLGAVIGKQVGGRLLARQRVVTRVIKCRKICSKKMCTPQLSSVVIRCKTPIRKLPAIV